VAEALGTGWLVALFLGIPAFVTTIFVPTWKWAAAIWRKPLERSEAEKLQLVEALKEKTDELLEVRQRCMEYEIRYDYCQSELRNWRSGRGGVSQ